ncbi:helix-turn-helix domain-containing protein [Streptomyces sp. NBC_00663]|uniref:helix-turn-helix domain-containing protein n=1 Tax=Streptomyces sp. NBC_00663 TaxID=2975801 RepID=UPI002E35B316|nr:helix-turn-helix transcriptional regulator [Streptomyces sp. NBC_00663]
MKSALFNADEVKRRLYLQGMHGQQLAAVVGVSNASISYYLSGQRTPSAPVFLRICKALGAEPEDLYVDADAPASSVATSSGNAA